MKLKTIAIAILAASLAQTVFAGFASVAFSGQKELKITRVTPSGKDIPAGEQIVFQFNRPVVAIGRMERSNSEIPVDISPNPGCKWRWLNTSSLACQLNGKNKLKQATKYTITMKPGISAEDGATITETYTHGFITQRPQISYFLFVNWQNPGTPVIRLHFNQPVSKSSVEEHIAFTYRKPGAKRKYITIGTKVEKDPDDKQKPHYVVVPAGGYLLDGDDKSSENGNTSNNPASGGPEKEEARSVWVVSPEKELPPDADVALKTTPGLVSALGNEKGVQDRIVTNFNTFPEFTFVGLICTGNDNIKVFVTKKNNRIVDKCNPQKEVGLSFSAPVLRSKIKNNVIINPPLADSGDHDPWLNYRDYSSLASSYTRGKLYKVWLPIPLKPLQAYTLKTKKTAADAANKVKSGVSKVLTSNIKDEFGRTLKNPIDLTFFTDHFVSNFNLVHRNAVLEEQTDSDVPLYVTNIDSATFYYDKITPDGVKRGQALKLGISKVQDVPRNVPMRIRDVLGNKSGAVYGTIKTLPYVKKYPDQSALFATVTPFQLNVKIGHYNTLVWVTDLETGEPVKDALVRIYQDKISNLSTNFKALAKGKTDASGLVELKGANELDPKLDLFSSCMRYKRDVCTSLFVRIDKADKMALMPLNEDFWLNTYRASNNTVGSETKKEYGHIRAWGTTAQGVYRAGGTIKYKIYVRNQNNDKYVQAPAKTYTLEIVDPTGKTVQEIKDITLSEFGGYSGEYNIPENAAVGWYGFKLKSNFTSNYTWQPMRVLVSEFTPASFKVVNSLNGDLFHPEEEMEISSSAKLHSGGSYTDAEVRITATLEAAYFSSKNPVANNFIFDSYKKKQRKDIFHKIDNTGDKGETKHSFRLPREDIIFGRLTVESAVRDDRGKYIAASSRADYVAVNRLVGLKHTRWVYEEGKPAEIKYIVVDDRGVPAADTHVTLKVERLQTKAAKVKGAGNAYLTNYIDEWTAAGNCEGISKTEPLICSFTPAKPGIYRITAAVKDTNGHEHSTETRAWVVGKGRVVWRSSNDNSMQIIPEKAEYNIGDKARYLIKNPYPGAKALISIERYGVLKSWTQELKSSTPVIEFDVEKDFVPGFYLSVIVVSPRVASPPDVSGQIDLGKPAFRVGYVKVPVKDPYKRINVSVKTDAEVYKPRDKVSATIHAEVKHQDKNERIEIGVAVLDEAVLSLLQGGKSYFDPYEGFYKLGNLDLRNYNLLTRLIGSQKFAKKGANPGGDGGADISMRSLFKYVSYWNPSVKPDKNGNATINFEVPDNLTGWRILAFAVTPTDRMGFGDTNFKVNRPTEIRPVMPNQVTEGDTFQAGFSVMNRTDKSRDITVTIDITGDARSAKRFSKVINLEPYKRQSVYVPVSSAILPQSKDTKTGAIIFAATAQDAVDSDGIKYTVPTYKRHSLETAANYGTTTQDSVIESLNFPKDIHSDVGNVSVVLSPSVIGNVSGAFRYMRDYPYACWEQKLSKGVMASHYNNLRSYLPDDLKWDESKTLPDDILKQAADYQAPNGGMVYYIPMDKYVSPYLSAYTALAFNWLREGGYEVPEAVEAKLHAYLEKLLKKDAVSTFYSRGMVASVRAVALAALAKHGKVSLNDLERYRSHINYMDLFGKAHYLQAVLAVDGAKTIAKEVTSAILSHSYQSGGKFGFNEELDNNYSRILATPLRSNCGILSAITKYGEDEVGAVLVGDVPFRLMRSVTRARDNRDHWANTQENIFCMNSLIDYARIYEKVKPDMRVFVKMDEEELGETGFKDLRDDAVILSRGITKDDPGTKRSVSITKSGSGRLYYTTRMSYAPSDANASRVSSGIDIRKEYSVERNGQWVLLNNPNQIKRGELMRVDIYVSLPTARNFVVVDDPVPGGLEPVNRDLANTSMVDANGGEFQAAEGSWWFQFDDWHAFNTSRWSFYHKELRNNAVRFYSDYLPAGNYHLFYTAQAIAKGEFTKMPVHAEEMYDPDVFGKGLPGILKVDDK